MCQFRKTHSALNVHSNPIIFFDDVPRLNCLNLFFFPDSYMRRNRMTIVGDFMSSPVVLWTVLWLSTSVLWIVCVCLRCIFGLCSCPRRGNEIIWLARSDVDTFRILNAGVAFSASSWKYLYIMLRYFRMLANEMSLLIPYVSAGRRTLVLSITSHHKGLWR